MSIEEEVVKPLYYLIIYARDDKGIAKFYAGTTESKGVLEAKIPCRPDLVEGFARAHGLRRKGRGRKIRTYTTSDWNAYAATMIYAAITSPLRSQRKRLEAIDKVESLSFLDLRYWAGTISERYRERGYKGILRPARALRILLGIDKR